MSREVHVPKSLISKIFEPFLKSCTSEVHVPWGRVPRGLTVLHKQKEGNDIRLDHSILLYTFIKFAVYKGLWYNKFLENEFWMQIFEIAMKLG